MPAHRFPSDHALADWDIADPGSSGAIPVTQSGVCNITTAAGETRTIADPTYVGQWLMLVLDTDGGDATCNFANAINAAGNDQVVFADAGDSITVRAGTVGGNLRWRIVESDGGTLGTQ